MIFSEEDEKLEITRRALDAAIAEERKAILEIVDEIENQYGRSWASYQYICNKIKERMEK